MYLCRAVEPVPRPSSANSDKSSNTTDDEDHDPPHEYFKYDLPPKKLPIY